VYGIEDYIQALSGLELVDYETRHPYGLTLHRYGGFYWKFVVNRNWKTLNPGNTFIMKLRGNNWMSSASDIFNNWAFGCTKIECCHDGFQTIKSTEMTNDQAYFPSPMSGVTDQHFQRYEGDKWISWDANGGLERFNRYSNFSPSDNIVFKNDVKELARNFSYRGLHIDFARNFFREIHGRSFVEEIINLLERLNLNKFHMHLSDDQGWRLEIPDIPELTQYGASRCYGEFKNEYGGKTGFPCLFPGPQDTVDDTHRTNLYFDRDEFINLLKFATEKGIDIIPEFDFPAHASAAIESMEYRHYMNPAYGGDFRLVDPDETFPTDKWARYYNGQINVCLDSTYDFLKKIVKEVKSMYVDAGLFLLDNPPLFHLGGDETPDFAWTQYRLLLKWLLYNTLCI